MDRDEEYRPEETPDPILSHMLNCTCYLTARVGGSYCPQVRAFLDGLADALAGSDDPESAHSEST